ncbi:hypothetical protein [Acinetobacter tianfuensis]|uniref:Uncharacterized protein n=1 Tax=Acinetobacter tianfuensis TaxID=2419603 RepID=A0A3A8EH16_9GAMM|nr:hypothetical protein [Acinetobacter tianfuensis]RKG29294.1 hypothetical protein D7V32_15610 [Acinetobacter tianfuensis]
MHSSFKYLCLPALLCTALFIQGCERKTETVQPEPEQSQDDKIMQELSSEPVKDFAKTEFDTADIQALLDYDQRFTAVSDDMENELMQMKEQGTLSDTFAAERKRDNINSALSMLKELDLKTEQGRYIQGLIYQYWDSQKSLLAQAASEPAEQHAADKIKGLGQFLHAQEQLAHWQAQYPELNTAAQ